MNVELADDHWTKAASHTLSLGALIDRARADALENCEEDIQQAVFNGKYSATIHLLAGYSLELLLKSACCLAGCDEGRLRSRKLRHDLVALLDEAESLGFGTSVPNVRWVAEQLREPHLNHQFRYGGAEQVVMPALELTLNALYGLCDELHSSIDAANNEAAPI